MHDLVKPTRLYKMLTPLKPFIKWYIKKLIKKVDIENKYMHYFVNKYLNEKRFNLFTWFVVLKWINQHLDFARKMAAKEINPRSCKLLNEETQFFISGLPRSGTSFLNEYLAIDQSNRTILYSDLDKDIPKEVALYNLLYKDAGTIINSIHPLDAIAEDLEAMALYSIPNPFIRIYDMENWPEVPGEDLFSANYPWLRHFMEKMNSTEENKRFLFKSPFSHIIYYNEFKKVFPKHQILLCYRSVVPVALSWCRMYDVVIHSNYLPIEVDPKTIGPIITQFISLYKENLNQALSEGRIEIVYFDEMIANPVKIVKKLYNKFSWDWTDSLEKKYQTNHEIQKRKHAARIEKKPFDYYGLDKNLLEDIDRYIAESIRIYEKRE